MCDQDFMPDQERYEKDEDPAAGFYQGWNDVMNGNTYPISTLWDDIDEE